MIPKEHLALHTYLSISCLWEHLGYHKAHLTPGGVIAINCLGETHAIDQCAKRLAQKLQSTAATNRVFDTLIIPAPDTKSCSEDDVTTSNVNSFLFLSDVTDSTGNKYSETIIRPSMHDLALSIAQLSHPVITEINEWIPP